MSFSTNLLHIWASRLLLSQHQFDRNYSRQRLEPPLQYKSWRETVHIFVNNYPGQRPCSCSYKLQDIWTERRGVMTDSPLFVKSGVKLHWWEIQCWTESRLQLLLLRLHFHALMVHVARCSSSLQFERSSKRGKNLSPICCQLHYLELKTNPELRTLSI